MLKHYLSVTAPFQVEMWHMFEFGSSFFCSAAALFASPLPFPPADDVAAGTGGCTLADEAASTAAEFVEELEPPFVSVPAATEAAGAADEDDDDEVGIASGRRIAFSMPSGTLFPVRFW